MGCRSAGAPGPWAGLTLTRAARPTHFARLAGGRAAAGSEEEVKTLLEELESGVSYMIGHTCVQAHESSPAVKKFAINVVYGFLRRNSRRPAVELGIPNTSLIEVGMTYKI